MPGAAERGLTAAVQQHLAAGRQVALCLDYDGTLVPVAPAPEAARPTAALLSLLSALADAPGMLVAIISGRALASLGALLPVPGLTLAGTYGLEIRAPRDGVALRVDPDAVRPTVERIRSAWADLVDGRPGFLLEDKGLAVALHASRADPADAALILPAAESAATQLASDRFRFVAGERFVEFVPAEAHKGRALDWLLDQRARPGAWPVYVGDDEWDEAAFAAVERRGGASVAVGPRAMRAAYRLDSPQAVQAWLRRLRGTIVRAERA